MKMESIDDDRWQSAQFGELQGFLDYESNQELVDGTGYAVDVMLNKHLGMDLEKDFVGKVVLESGGGKLPAISFVKGLERFKLYHLFLFFNYLLFIY